MRWFKRQQCKSKDPETRRQALEYLRENAGAKEIELFAVCLLDQNVKVRNVAEKVIAGIHPSRIQPCIEALLPLLKNPDYNYRRGGALALKSLGWNPTTGEEKARYHVALGEFKEIPSEEAAVEPILDALKTGSLIFRVGAAQALERLLEKFQDQRTTTPLIHALNDSEAHLRVAAANALGNSTDEPRIFPLLDAFKHASPQVRAAAVEAIGKTGNIEYFPHLKPLLKDASFEVRTAAINALGCIKSPEVVDAIVPSLKDSDSDVRKSAVESLAKLRDPRSAGALISTLIDPESTVRHAAANALQVLNCDWRISEEAKKAIPFLEAALHDREFWVREAAGKALNRIKNL